MLQLELDKKNLNYEPMPKSKAIKVHKKWLNNFANKTKEITGKWKAGDYLWEAFGDIQPATTNTKAMELFKQKKIEPFYVFDESGKHCYYCEADKYPDFYSSG